MKRLVYKIKRKGWHSTMKKSKNPTVYLMAIIFTVLFTAIQMVVGIPSYAIAVCFFIEMLIIRAFIDKKAEPTVLIAVYLIAVIVISFGPDRINEIIEALRSVVQANLMIG